MKINKTFIFLLLVCVVITITTFIGVNQQPSQQNNNVSDNVHIEVSPERTPTSTPVTEIETREPEDSTAGDVDKPLDTWELITNKKHGFSYHRPRSGYPFYVDIDYSTKSLEAFANGLWTSNKYDTNPYAQGKSVSEIMKTTINESTAYQFTVSKSFVTSHGGYVLDEPFLFTIFATATGTKLISRIPVADRDRDTILNSFVIDSVLIPVNQEPDDWRKVVGSRYEFQYPANVFSVVEHVADRIYLEDKYVNMRGSVIISATNQLFDPAHIEGMYGRIENPEPVTIDQRTWYAYTWGDAGATARIYMTNLPTGTLRVSFGSTPDEEVYPIVYDTQLQTEILKTFSF